MAARCSLKTPKGTRDWVGGDLVLRDQIFQTITTILSRHGGIPLDTPVFELRGILSEKYGEDGAGLIYDLADQGGEACSLRYDLTVPFARWLATRSDVQRVRRYQVAKVYRRDQPAVARGRLREFYQCDFDIAGVYDSMVPDAEVVCVISEVFRALGIGTVVKLNHRKILDGLFASAGVGPDKIRAASSAIDKLDKLPWAEVRRELLAKDLPPDVADRVGSFVQQRGSLREILDTLQSNPALAATTNKPLSEGLADMALLATYLEAFGVLDAVSFDLSLARGLDYYTGLIYEVVVVTADDDDGSAVQGVGSIAAGGRYDDLVGLYGRGRPLPCVGISFGVDRIFTILDARRKKAQKKKKKNNNNNADLAMPAEVYIMAFGGQEFDGLLLERMRVARELWGAGIRAEFVAKVKPKPLQQFNASEGVPVAVMLGQEELDAGQVRVKCLYGEGEKGDGEKKKDRGELVTREEMVVEVRRLLAEANGGDE